MSPQHHHLQHFADRRFKVFERMGTLGACLIPANKKIIRNGDAEYAFRQSSNLYYLTGWPEDNALLLLLAKDGKQKSIIFCQEADELEKRWVGDRVGIKRALSDYGLDEAYDFSQIQTMLPELLSGCDKIYYPVGQDVSFDESIHSTLSTIGKLKRKGWVAPKQHIEVSELLDELRLVKMGDEIARMRKAASISAKAHIRGMQHIKPDMYEYELEAEYRYEFLKHGAHDVAYLPIVAAGDNACVLHYTDNNKKIVDGDLVLVDAGCEYQGYAADITRTFPANGKFTKPQQAIYELVLASQIAAIDVAKSGIPWDQMQREILKVLVQGMVDLNILSGEVDDLIAQGAYQSYYMHQSGHWLGLDVHDVGEYKIDGQWRALKPGMMLTIEPGLYFPPEDQSVDEAYRGIGIRIEDDVLVTDSQADVISKEVPKTVQDIEQLMKS